jgi:hypothetical protein
MMGEMLQSKEKRAHERLPVTIARKLLFLLVLPVILTFIARRRRGCEHQSFTRLNQMLLALTRLKFNG